MDIEESERIMRAAQAVRLGMNMHTHDTRPGPGFFSVFVKAFVWIIIGLAVLGTQADKIQPYLNKWQAYEDAKHQ